MKNFTLYTLIVVISLFFIGTINAQTTIDLTDSSDPDILKNTLGTINSGDTILLKPGMTYNAALFKFSKTVTIQSSEPLNLIRPKIDCSMNYNFEDGSTIDSIIFRNLEFSGSFASNYILNVDKSANVGKIQFDGCYIHDLRGVFRIKGGAGSIDNFVISNSIVSMINGYGVLFVGLNTWMVNNILFQNSTFSKNNTFLISKNNCNSLIIDGVTLSEVPLAVERMFRWDGGDGYDNVLNGIKINNTIWGTGWDNSGSGYTAFDAFDGLPATTWTIENSYITSDYTIASGKDAIPGLNNVYSGLSTDLWVNPAADSFQIADTVSFDGYGNAGDQRWAAATADGGVEMNISSDAYNALGTISNTTKVAGLTITANSTETVIIEEDDKTVGDMSFTSRLNLGGSGTFDVDGIPVGKVLTVEVQGNSVITVAAMSSSPESDRVLNIAAGDKDNLIGEHTALGASLTMSSFKYIGDPTTLLLYSPSDAVNVYYVKISPAINNDSLLSSLSIDAGILEPAFDPAVEAYTVELPTGTTNVNVTAISNNPFATISGDGDIDVSSGSAVANITVLAADGVADMEYTISFTVIAAPALANIKFVVDASNHPNATGFTLKGSWNTTTGEYDASGSDGAEHSVFFDDGTNGDVTAGDHIWTVTLALVPDGGSNTWQWSVNDAGGNLYNGDFQFTVSDINDQTLTAYVVTGIDRAISSNFNIYPNPASSVLHIDNAEQISKVEVLSLSGQQLLYKLNMSNSTFSLPVEGLAKGVYILRLTEKNNEISNQRLIIE